MSAELFKPITPAEFHSLLSQTKDNFKIFEIDLSVARDKAEFSFLGTIFQVEVMERTGAGSEKINFEVRFNDKDKQPLEVDNFIRVEGMFHRFFITNTVQNAKVKLFCGNNFWLIPNWKIETVDKTTKTVNLTSHLIAPLSIVKIKDETPARRQLAIYNSHASLTVYMGTTNLNTILPIPALAERGLPMQPFYTGEIWIENVDAVDTVEIIVWESIGVD